MYLYKLRVQFGGFGSISNGITKGFGLDMCLKFGSKSVTRARLGEHPYDSNREVVQTCARFVK